MDNFSPEFDSQEDDALCRAVDEFERCPVETEPANNILIEALVDFERHNATPPVERGKFYLSVKKTIDQYICLLTYLQLQFDFMFERRSTAVGRPFDVLGPTLRSHMTLLKFVYLHINFPHTAQRRMLMCYVTVTLFNPRHMIRSLTAVESKSNRCCK